MLAKLAENPRPDLIALLGRRDEPTDAVREYCSWLAQALEKQGRTLELVEVDWKALGWRKTWRELRRQSRAWRGRWVFLQYTALLWSRHGFSFRVLAVLALLRWRAARIGVVFHDAQAFAGRRLIDRARRACQHWIMRRACAWSRLPIFTVPPDRLPWPPANLAKAVFIPVGANFSAPADRPETPAPRPRHTATIAVFGVTSGARTLTEAADISYVGEQVSRPGTPLRLIVLGRGSAEAEPHLRQLLHGTGVELSVLGLLPPAEVVRTLSRADVLLFVRGHISSRRSSAIVGIACGLPIVAYRGLETACPITEAGVLLVPEREREALARALARVLAEDALREELRARSRAAHQKYFSWDAIAGRYLAALGER